MGKAIDIIGLKFGKLIVEKRAEKYYSASGQSIVFYECKCDCGNVHKVRSIHLRRGKIQSCGNCEDKLHGESNSRLYRIWNTMRYRTSEDYSQKHLYYEKGIQVCNEWQKYKSFAEWSKSNGYKEGLQIDRRDNSKGYNPDNCRWITSKENCNNRDVTFMVNYKGVDYPFTQLTEIKNLTIYSGAIRARIKRGWSIEDAFDTPIRKGAFGRKYFTENEYKKAERMQWRKSKV